MTKDFHDVISLSGPAVIDDTRAGRRVVDLFPIVQNLSLTGRNGPNDNNLMLLSATVSARESLFECLFVGETKAPAYGPKRV